MVVKMLVKEKQAYILQGLLVLVLLSALVIIARCQILTSAFFVSTVRFSLTYNVFDCLCLVKRKMHFFGVNGSKNASKFCSTVKPYF